MSVSSVLLCVLIGLISYLLVKLRARLNYWQSHGIACDKPNIIFGNLTGIRKTRSFPQIWMEYYKKYKGTGPFAGFYWFQKPCVFILDPNFIKNILIKEFGKFTDRGFWHNEDDDPLTGHLFLLDEQKWKNMRNKLSPTFTSGKMKFMFPTIMKVGYTFVEVVGKMVENDPIVEVKDLTSRFTTDVIGTCAFGIECNSLIDPETKFRVMGKRALVESRHGNLGIAFLNNFPQLSRKLHMKSTLPEIEDFFMGIVRETITYREKNNVHRNDFMDMLIDLKNNKLVKTEDGNEMMNLTFKQVVAQAFIFFAAGLETSSTTMGFALYELARHEDIQERAREEINKVLENYNGEMTYESMKDMTYLDQIISETLRMYTVLPVLNRYCLEDYAVPNDPKFVIKKGMLVLIPIGAIHRDPEYFPNPDEFNPENFSPEMEKNRDFVLHIPFGEGPRNCIGMRFGQMQVRIGLAVLLNKFRFSVCDKTPTAIELDKVNYLVQSVGGIHLKVENV